MNEFIYVIPAVGLLFLIFFFRRKKYIKTNTYRFWISIIAAATFTALFIIDTIKAATSPYHSTTTLTLMVPILLYLIIVVYLIKNTVKFYQLSRKGA
jgi:hypothetical protein